MLSGRIAVVTGANTGIGFYTALQLAALHAHVVLACRRPEAAQEAINAIRRQVPYCSIEFLQLDVSSLHSVRDFAAALLDKHPKIHILVNNAGIAQAATRGVRSREGFNLVFATNYLGPFYLTSLLLPALQAAAPSRVVNVSSVMHRYSNLAAVKAMPQRGNYAATKLANVLHGYEIHRRFAGKGVSCVVVSPGAVNSDIWRHQTSCTQKAKLWVMQWVFLTCLEGSATSVAGVTGAAPDPGELRYLVPYYMNSCCPRLTELCGPFAGPREVSSSQLSYDLTAARELWQDSLRWVEEGLGKD